MYENVLLPTDGSEGTRRAIRHAIAIARRFDATLHVLSVLVEGPYGSLDREDVRTSAEADADRAIDRVRREAKREGLDVVATLRTGVPDEEIVAYADENDVDLIVMGTHGRSGLDRMLLGSVTERVVRTASIPVVTVRADDQLAVADAEAATRIAVEALAERGHEDATVREEPHRTSGSWIVPVESDGVAGHVHIDAATGDARVASLD